MLVVCVAFGVAHRVVLEFLACFAQTRGCGLFVDYSFLEITHPFFKRRLCHFVEVVHTHKIVCGEYLCRVFRLDDTLLFSADDKVVLGMDTHEIVLPDIQIIGATTKVEVENADGVDLLHLLISIAELYVFGYCFSHAVEDTFEIIKLARILHLHNDYLSLRVFGFDIHAVELVVGRYLIAFAFENLHYFYLFVEEDGKKTLQHVEVGLLTQQSLNGPVKSYASIFQ